MDKSDNSIVGDGGFKGTPNDNGVIEIGYGIIEGNPEYIILCDFEYITCSYGLFNQIYKYLLNGAKLLLTYYCIIWQKLKNSCFKLPFNL